MKWAFLLSLLLHAVPVMLMEEASYEVCETAGDEAENHNWTEWKRDSFLSAAGVAVGTCSATPPCNHTTLGDDTTLRPTETPEQQRPKCEEGVGCDSPLYCFDFRTRGEDSIVPDPPRAVKVTSLQLERTLENPFIRNCCALVMFYAPWCSFSAQFARRFNALGRTFSGLPVLALDLGENDPHKYILAYLPVVAFYYRGRVLMRFNDLSASYEDLRNQIANITGFVPRDVELMDGENEGPVETVRVDSDRYLLHAALLWLIFVMLVCMLRSRLLASCLEHFGSRIGRRPFLQHNLQ